jgi:pyrroline-5-carboxylate reductase
MTHELGVIGAGNMAEAIVRGVLGKGQLKPAQIIAADPSEARRALFTNELHVRAVGDNAAVAAASPRMLLLSVKPQHMQAALAALGPVLDPRHTLVISIAAGISTGFIERHLSSGARTDANWRVIRTMPNTPMLVGQGVVAIAPGRHATDDDVASARRLFEAAAVTLDVDESLMNAVTALSGSGPAYFFYLVEHMIRAGVELGLTPQQAHTLVTKTAQGAAAMLMTSSQSSEELRRKVTSPGGTTQAAITHMDEHRMPAIIVDAIKAAERRGRELGQ